MLQQVTIADQDTQDRMGMMAMVRTRNYLHLKNINVRLHLCMSVTLLIGSWRRHMMSHQLEKREKIHLLG